MTPRHLQLALIGAACLSGALVVGCARESSNAERSQSESGDVVVADNIVVRSSIAPDDPDVADTIVLTLSIDSPPDAVITWPDVASVLPDTLEFSRERVIEPQAAPEGTVTRTRRFELTPLLAGDQVIPPLPFLIDEELILQTNEMSIHVRSVLGESAELAPRKDIASPPPDYRTWALFGGGVLAGAALLALIAFLAVRRLSRQETAPRRSAHDVALERLRALLRGDLLDRGRIELFLSELADILRHYIEDRFAIHAPAQTTEEFLHAARASGKLTIDRSDELGAFLQRCDLVKFARAGASRDDAERAVEMVRQFIENSATANAEPATSDTDTPVVGSMTT